MLRPAGRRARDIIIATLTADSRAHLGGSIVAMGHYEIDTSAIAKALTVVKPVEQTYAGPMEDSYAGPVPSSRIDMRATGESNAR